MSKGLGKLFSITQHSSCALVSALTVDYCFVSMVAQLTDMLTDTYCMITDQLLYDAYCMTKGSRPCRTIYVP